MANAALAQISCRLVGNCPMAVGDPGAEKIHFMTTDPEKGGHLQRLPACIVSLRPRKSFTVGRDTDPQINTICVENFYVSRSHFEIYSVVYEEEFNVSQQQPMIYVRDRQSLSGTSVNGRSIGSKTGGPSQGYLLSHGDVIRIDPHWEFEISLPQGHSWSLPLKGIQSLEAEAGVFCHRYLVTDRVLGSGNLCVIRLGIDLKTGKQLACKVNSLDHARANNIGGQDLVRAMIREVDILGKVRHPNLLTFECAFRSNHTIYIFTELATGGDLFSMYEANDGFFSEEQTKFVMHQVVGGIDYLHKRGLAHRDLKPENIFFASGPDIRNRVIVGDFGGSKGTTWGRMMSSVGTELYVSPEQHYGHSDHTKSVDMWSIGMICLVLMATSAKRYFENLKKMNQEMVDETLGTIFTSPSHADRFISKEGQDFIRRCLKVDGGNRMTAKQAKKHNWLALPQLMTDEWTRVRDESWKPTHLTPPPVEDLPDLQFLTETTHLKLVNKKNLDHVYADSHQGKRRLDRAGDAQVPGSSPYFLPSGPPKTATMSKSISRQATRGRSATLEQS